MLLTQAKSSTHTTSYKAGNFEAACSIQCSRHLSANRVIKFSLSHPPGKSLPGISLRARANPNTSAFWYMPCRSAQQSTCYFKVSCIGIIATYTARSTTDECAVPLRGREELDHAAFSSKSQETKCGIS
jgi:hypothetical protein